MVHQYKMNGYNIVLDSCSGTIHVVDEPVYDVIAMFQDNDEDTITQVVCDKYKDRGDVTEADVRECIEDIKGLIKEGKLFSPDTFADMAGTFKEHSGNVIKALCLHVAHTCNLNCDYCFASQGKFHGERALMSFEVGKRALDFLIENSGTRTNLEVDFFGGEPLMNWEVVKQLVEYARSVEKQHGKNFRFTVTTNGVLLNDDIKQYINENMSNVVLSIDGTKETNDRMRYRVDGSGSYDTIVPKFQDLAESRNQNNYYVRGTFTAYNVDFAKDVIHLADLGFKQTSVEPVVAPETEDYALTSEHIEKVCAEYDKLTEEYVKRYDEGRGFNFFHFMVDLDQGPCAIKRLSGCGAGHEYLAVAPNGDIYPCHQFVGNKDFLMGNVNENKIDENIEKMFERSNVYTKEKCKNCFAKFYCSGGCSANAYNFNGDINKPYELACEFEKKRLECSIAIEAHKKLS